MKYWLSVLFVGSLCCANAQHRGTIFEDLNKNGKMDAEEKGISSVMVSDGYSVVKTDAGGHFSLEENENGRFVFVTVPSGFKPSGKFYIKIESAIKNYDIGLAIDEYQHADKLDFIQITDTETPLYGPWIDNVRNYASAQGTSFILHTGDICYEPGMRFHAQHVNSQLMGVPTYYSVGNHDLVKGEYGEKLYEDLFGPAYYSFEAGPAHFVVTPMWSGDYAPSYSRDQVIEWLKQDLKTKDNTKPLIFVNHDFDIGPDFVLKGKQQQIDLKQYNLKGWLFGHWHNNYVFRDKLNDVKVVSTNAPNKGGIDHAAGQFLHIEVNREGIQHISPVYTNLRGKAQLITPTVRQGKLRFLANVYDSERRIAKVLLTGLDARGNKLFAAGLKANTDWAWTGSIEASKGKGMVEALLEIRYANGDHEWRKQILQSKDSGFQVNWSINIGSNIWKTSPLLVDDILVTASFDDGGNERSAIVALDKKSGEQLWSYRTDNSIKQKLQSYKDLILATDAGGNAYAINIKTGREVWKLGLSKGKLPNYMSAGTLYEGIYYTGFGHYLVAIDAVTGKIIWRNSGWNDGQAMPGELLATEKYLFTGANWNSLFAHDRFTGKLLWKKEDEGVRFRSGGVTEKNGEVYVAGLNGLFVLDPAQGKVLRKQFYDHEFKVMASPTVLENIVLVPNSVEGISAYNKNTLERVWNFRTGEALIYTSSYTSPDQRKLVSTVESTVKEWNGNLIFGASDGYLYMLDQQGKMKDKIYFGAPLLADVTTDGKQIYVVDFAGNAYSLQYSMKK